jgi:hypothetical protein
MSDRIIAELEDENARLEFTLDARDDELRQAKGELARLAARLEDRTALAGVVLEAESQFAVQYQDSDELPLAKDKYLAVADRIRAYLKE